MATNNYVISGVCKKCIADEKSAFITVKTVAGNGSAYISASTSMPSLAKRANKIKEGDPIVIEGRLESYKDKKGSMHWILTQLTRLEKIDHGMMNSIVVQGRLTNDPEVINTSNGSAVKLNIVNSRSYPKDNEFIEVPSFLNIIKWDTDHLSFRKGDSVWVTGYVQTRSYEKDGEKRYITEICATNICAGGTGKRNINFSEENNIVSSSNDSSVIDEELPY